MIQKSGLRKTKPGSAIKVSIDLNPKENVNPKFPISKKLCFFLTKKIEVVKEFVYLGSLMTSTNDASLEIQRRI
jgi:hypothetical protein